MKIKVDGSFYIDFNDFSFSSQLDSVGSTFGFASRFDPEDENHKVFFKPLSFHTVEFFNDDDKLFFTGNVIAHKFLSLSSRKLVGLSGYSKCGILEDCTIPYKNYPLETNLSNLKDISEKLLKLFDLGFVVDASVSNEMSMAYQNTIAKPDESVKEYLSKLASQKNIIISHNEKGDLVFFRPNPKGNPVIFYDKENCQSMSITYNGQNIHSDLTVISQPEMEEGAGSSIVAELKNPLVSKFRSSVKILSSGENTDVERDVKNIMGEQLKSISLVIELRRWDDVKNGDIIEVQNDELYIYKKEKFMIASITQSEKTDGRKMTITAVLPESFSGDEPKNIFE